jgi:hypothetical protein
MNTILIKIYLLVGKFPSLVSLKSLVIIIWSLVVGSYYRPLFIISVACVVGPNVNPLQNRETQHVNIVLQCMYQFFEELNMKGNHA